MGENSCDRCGGCWNEKIEDDCRDDDDQDDDDSEEERSEAALILTAVPPLAASPPDALLHHCHDLPHPHLHCLPRGSLDRHSIVDQQEQHDGKLIEWDRRTSPSQSRSSKKVLSIK